MVDSQIGTAPIPQCGRQEERTLASPSMGRRKPRGSLMIGFPNYLSSKCRAGVGQHPRDVKKWFVVWQSDSEANRNFRARAQDADDAVPVRQSVRPVPGPGLVSVPGLAPAPAPVPGLVPVPAPVPGLVPPPGVPGLVPASSSCCCCSWSCSSSLLLFLVLFHFLAPFPCSCSWSCSSSRCSWFVTLPVPGLLPFLVPASVPGPDRADSCSSSSPVRLPAPAPAPAPLLAEHALCRLRGHP
ncbi:hypothetical protein CBR_g3149 [Chara braunii]|uniref:Uncharacterized protein n=1 Tax=Chara braunii TaxID=69332 RepID=A0A388KEX5_CHABU|nr:hypothetical protein CBR_g3149 [Chara braunii]|eukprot:GBG68608.1 hypothetical protein CBR_g3149 [Chara braunii]